MAAHNSIQMKKYCGIPDFETKIFWKSISLSLSCMVSSLEEKKLSFFSFSWWIHRSILIFCKWNAARRVDVLSELH